MHAPWWCYRFRLPLPPLNMAWSSTLIAAKVNRYNKVKLNCATFMRIRWDSRARQGRKIIDAVRRCFKKKRPYEPTHRFSLLCTQRPFVSARACSCGIVGKIRNSQPRGKK